LHNKSSQNEYGIKREAHYQPHKSGSGEQRRTNKWLADTLGKDCTTVSKWCTNTAQPGLETLVKIAECLNVDARELIVPTKK
jgi:hypothetical protein